MVAEYDPFSIFPFHDPLLFSDPLAMFGSQEFCGKMQEKENREEEKKENENRVKSNIFYLFVTSNSF